MKNYEFSVLLFFEKIPKWRGWKDIFYEDDVIHAEQISRTLSFFFLFFFFFLHFTNLLSVHARFAGNKAYSLNTRGGKIPVYCHMTRNGIGKCGGGGWTLVMKIDGHKVEWNAFWIEKVGEGLRTTHFGSSSPHIFFVCFFQSVRADFLAANFFSDFTLQTYA